MPWTCCSAQLLDTVTACPACGRVKHKWTTTFQATRLFVVGNKRWIELHLSDTAGKPLAGERYVVTDARGKTHAGALDADGLGRVDRLPTGRCRVAFPALDGAEWDWEVEEPEPAPAAPPAWVELQLRDAAGRPLAGERYRLVLPGGEVREGQLGPDGVAREECPEAGRCKVSFPELDGAEWAAEAEGADPPSSTAPPQAAVPVG